MNNIKFKIAIVDDENILRIGIAEDLRDEGYEVIEFTNASALLINLKEIDPDVVITDLKMADIDGIELLTRLKQIKPLLPVILITAYASLKTAILAMKKGAYDYLSKPFESEELLLMLQRIREINDVRKDNVRLRKQLYSTYDYSTFVGSSEPVKKLFELVKVVADTDTTICISGNTGTGKELLTNIIHYNSSRRTKPFIKVNCAVLAKEIFESELFGHEKGSFTGAEIQKPGRFEMANGGTIYLDDIDDMPLDLQVKLLRVLEESEIERVGGTKTIKLDVRVIVSTKVNLKDLVEAGKFREDLYYRIHVFPIHIPSLKERKNDIRELITYFVSNFSNSGEQLIDNAVFEILNKYEFPGNTRELKNLCERLVLLSQENRITIDMIPLEIKNPSQMRICTSVGEKPLPAMLSDFEISAINLALAKAKYNLTKASDTLGIPISTLRSKMEKYNVKIS